MSLSSLNEHLDSSMTILHQILKLEPDIRNITPRDFDRVLRCYSETVFNQVKAHDEQRFKIIPQRLRQSSAIPKGLKSGELEKLSYWTYKRCDKSRVDYCREDYRDIKRKRLSDDHVERITSASFSQYEGGDLTGAITTLRKGLPTACFETATLILSVAYPDKLPFFSPELAWYCSGAPLEKDGESDGNIYQAMLDLVKATCTRIQDGASRTMKTALDVEKVAYVLRLLEGLNGSYVEPGAMTGLSPLEGAANTRNSIKTSQLAKEHGDKYRSIPSAELFVVKSVSAQSTKEYSIMDYLQEIKIAGASYPEEKRSRFVKFFGWSFHDGHLLILMEHMTCDLHHRLGNETWEVKTNSSVKRPFIEMLGGIQAMHSEAIAHRDIKPQNIFIYGEDHIKIGDFGISKRARDGIYTTMITSRASSGYTAPEVLKAEDPLSASYNTKIDMWSLGCVLYRLLYGKNLFSSNDEVKDLGYLRLLLRRYTGPHLDVFNTTQEHGLLWRLVCLDVDKRLDAHDALEVCNGWSE